MDYIPRHIDKYLLEWKEDKQRKPLLLRGARQVGKSSSVRHLGKTFKHFLEINLERRSEARSIFEAITDPHEVAERLAVLVGVPIIPGETLLFIDEIQCSANAIKMLRYFKEDYPELHVVAAGSLLEFALADLSSYGVGRITSFFMHPFSFREFLLAQGKDMWVEAIEHAGIEAPLFEALHHNLVEVFRSFLLVGGMPASVAVWLDEGSYLKCAQVQEDIQQAYFDDFSKYSRKANPELLRAVLKSVIAQNGNKFVYSKVMETYKISDVKEALQMLCRAGLIHEVCMTSANGLPLGAEVNSKFKKYIFLDTGLMLRIQAFDMGSTDIIDHFILTASATDLVNKGSLAEMFVGLELIKNGNPRLPENLFYWENLNRGAEAEVDYVTAWHMAVLPIEVKSGISGKMKSLRLFMQNRSLRTAIRTSLENFGRINPGINIIPLYAIYNYRNFLSQTLTFTQDDDSTHLENA